MLGFLFGLGFALNPKKKPKSNVSFGYLNLENRILHGLHDGDQSFIAQKYVPFPKYDPDDSRFTST
jgi:hypothetical protein